MINTIVPIPTFHSSGGPGKIEIILAMWIVSNLFMFIWWLIRLAVWYFWTEKKESWYLYVFTHEILGLSPPTVIFLIINLMALFIFIVIKVSKLL